MSSPGIGNLQTLIKRLEAATSRLEDLAMAQSAGIGALVAEHAALVRAAFARTRDIVCAAGACQPPVGGATAPAFAAHLQPLQTELQRVLDLRDQNRGEKVLFNHLSTVSEGIPALGWIAVEPTPAPYVAEMRDSAQFYANRVIKEHKDGCVWGGD